MGKAFEEMTTVEQEFVLRNYVGTVLTTTDEVEGMEIPDGTDEVFKDLIWGKIKKFQKTLDKPEGRCYNKYRVKEGQPDPATEPTKVQAPPVSAKSPE